MNTAPAGHRIRSFVRREGRMTPAQKQALERLWPQYGVDLPLTRALFSRDAPRTLEIGFGNGEHLLAQATAHPDTDYLGIEVHRPGVGRLLQGLDRAQISNVRVFCVDAVEVLQQLEAGSLDCMQLYFPDPWPKVRHHKRRLVQPGFAALVARVLKPGGRWLLATDWRHYAEQMRDVLNAQAEFANLAGEGQFVPRPAERPLTRFERRGLKLGHEVFDLAYRRI